MNQKDACAFLGREVSELARVTDGSHQIRLIECEFPSGEHSTYVVVSESHDGARPERVVALSTLVHLVQNVGEMEMFQIGNREVE